MESSHAPALATIAATVEKPELPWLDAHFAFPLPPQGEPPAGWTPAELDLSAATCGACHAQQYADWKESWHAGGMGPGVMGQLVDWDGGDQPGADDALVTQCQTCHAPLAEQHPRRDGADNPVYTAALRAEGLSCAGCHVRAWQRTGPPRAEGVLAVEDPPHGGFEARTEYQDARFCAPCHDFKDGQKALEGKLVQETWAEWARTDYARDGVTCQDCHMPERRHLWKGVHDRDMVASGMTVESDAQLGGAGVVASLTVRNTGAGHRMPTYTTPQLTLVVEQVDAAGAALPGTTQQRAIARYLKPNLSEEYFDTRLLPGEALTLAYDAPRAPGAVAVVARVECWPDEAYRRFYEIKLKKADYAPKGRAQIEEALRRSIASRFVVTERSHPL